ncbi:SAM-dependent methyltransferase [Streptomyces mesophilus]|uniref:SAM-dependent methyltransferase n=1 Tax=Streptomyces mesophilus TaxID=1775132 RepID=UPI003333D7FF
MPTPRITVIGLGPGPRGMITPAALEAADAARRVHTTASWHPAGRLLGDRPLVTLEPEGDPSTAARHLIEEAHRHPVVLAVPGSPLVLEPVVAGLLATAPDSVRVVPGISFLDALWPRLGIDPFLHGVRVIPAETADAYLPTAAPLVLTDLTALPAGRLDAVIGSRPQSEAVLARHVGLPDENLLTVSPGRPGETVRVDAYTSLYLPAPPATSALAEALLAQQRGARLGYTMRDLDAAFADVEAEVQEARAEPTEAEAADILFAAVHVHRLLKADPDAALRAAVRRFTGRLDYVEALGEDLTDAPPERLRRLWALAKQHQNQDQH